MTLELNKDRFYQKLELKQIRKYGNMQIIFLLLMLLSNFQLDAIPTDAYLGGQYSYYSTNNLWNCNGTHLPAYNKFMRHDFKAYGGFDISPSSCLWAQGGFDSIRQQINPDRHGFEDVNIGFYHSLNETKDSSYGCGLLVDVPGGDPRSALRYGELAGEFFVSYQNKVCQAHYTLDLGYRIYNKNVSDIVRAALRIDWPFTRNIQLTAQGDLDFAVFNGKRQFYDNRMAFNPNTRLFKAKILGVYQITKMFYLNVGYFKYIWGQNVGSGGGVFGGAFWNY